MSDSVRPMAFLRVGAWVFLFLLFLIPAALSQYYNVLFIKSGAAADYRFGASVAGAGDVNGDGKPDFVVGAPSVNFGTGSVYVYSAVEASLLHQKNGPGSLSRFGYSVNGAGDVNGDGKSDFIVGAPDVNSIYLYSGTNGALLYQKSGSGRFGHSVAGAGDVNGDGKADFIVGAPDASQGVHRAGSAFVYSGLDGSLLYQKDGDVSFDNLGWSVDGAGDLNADEKADFVIGVPNDDFSFSNSGSAYVYSGANGSLLCLTYGLSDNDNLGVSVSGAEDVNGDGRSDFIAGAHRSNLNGILNSGSAFVWSGLTCGELYQKHGAAMNDFFGISVAGAGDVDSNAKADFIVGAYLTNPGVLVDAGSIYLYSGLNGSLLVQKNGAAAEDHFGTSVDGVGKMNGDGKSDFIVGAPDADPGGHSFAGTVYVFATCPKVKGDMDGDGSHSPADLVCLQYCVYYGSSICGCDGCYADMDCDGSLGPADLVLLQNLIYNGTPPPC